MDPEAYLKGTKAMVQTLSPEVIESIISGYNGDPFAVLGPHVVQSMGSPQLPCVLSCPGLPPCKLSAGMAALTTCAASTTKVYPRLSDFGDSPFGYTLRATSTDGHTWDFADPYLFGPMLSDFDLHLIGEGNHYRTYEKLGAHLREVNGTWGVHFAVWAPNALRVSVIGAFNRWDGRVHPMRLPPCTGYLGAIHPRAGRRGSSYKYQVRSRQNGYRRTRPTPMASSQNCALRPHQLSPAWSTIPGATTSGSKRGLNARGSQRPSPSTKCIWVHGVAGRASTSRKRKVAATSPTANWRTNL